MADLKYSNDFLNYFPTKCVAQTSSVFLYGLGSFVSGDLLSNGVSSGFVPAMRNPRRHFVLTFAKLEWAAQPLHEFFGASCKAKIGCQGLVHPLPASQRVLVLHEQFVPSELKHRDFRNPVRLATLNSKPFYYEQDQQYYEWEHINPARFAQLDWATNATLAGTNCSMYLDSYLRQIDKNKFFLEEPLQPLYTSALYYLLQDANVKTLSNANSTSATTNASSHLLGYVSLDGDREIKKITFAISQISAVATFVGLGVMLLLAALVVLVPQKRVLLSTHGSRAAKLVDVLTTATYPEAVHTRALVLPSGARVPIDEYTVECIAFEPRKQDAGKQVVL